MVRSSKGRGRGGFGIITAICELLSLSPLLQEKVRAVFDNLIQLEHLNIVKFHKYWADVKENKARVRCFFCLVFPEFFTREQLYLLSLLHSEAKTR